MARSPYAELLLELNGERTEVGCSGLSVLDVDSLIREYEELGFRVTPY